MNKYDLMTDVQALLLGGSATTESGTLSKPAIELLNMSCAEDASEAELPTSHFSTDSPDDECQAHEG